MSYCPWSAGDVYVFPQDEGIRCCACGLRDPREDSDPVFTKRAEIVAHLEERRRAGHAAPDYAFERLRYKIEVRPDRKLPFEEILGT